MSINPSRRRAIVILCIIFFLIPFGLRGARMALQHVKNDPNDWLPADFDETVELKWFAKHFISEKFAVITWKDCRADDPSFQMYLKKLAPQVNHPIGDELISASEPASEPQTEAERARLMGDRLGLFLTGDTRMGSGNHDDEKWLKGHGDEWYFITKKGELYKWDGGSGLVDGIILWVQEWDPNWKAGGEIVARVGQPSTPGSLNPYYKNPQLLTGRLFSSVLTGPELLEQLTAEDGPLRQSIESNLQDDLDVDVAAKALAYDRLTGSLFGKAPHIGFDWTKASFLELLSDAKRAELPEDWEGVFDEQVEHYGLEKLQAATGFDREYQWGELFDYLEIDQPARQTCIIVNFSDLGKSDMARVVGRPILGKPPGLLLRIAEQCGISTREPNHELRLGGPPVDNVAIDEEGTRTLVNLVGFSALVGFILSYMCFRSILVTIMVFLVGGVSAVISMAIVFYGGETADAILMSMPAVVYVLGLSGAVHIVNYYRDAVDEFGEDLAPWKALKIGWWPCTIAAFTTAIGLFSLYFSNIVPIRKFGLFSALGVLATLVLLFAYLPSALVTWPPGFKRNDRVRDDGSYTNWLENLVRRFWKGVGDLVIRHHALVGTVCLLLTIGVGWGLTRIDTSVQLLKLFDPNAKIIGDYRWMEQNLGKLVPMELVIRVDPKRSVAVTDDGKTDPQADESLRLNLLERLELTDRVQRVVESQFGPTGSDEMGRGMSAATFFKLPEPVAVTSSFSAAARTRSLMNRRLESSYSELLSMDYLRRDTETDYAGSELWRISLRLGALNDVDYGRFAHDLKFIVEPVMSAYRYREDILAGLNEAYPEEGFVGKRVVVLGLGEPEDPVESKHGLGSRSPALQSAVCFSTLSDLLLIKGFDGRFAPVWHDPTTGDAAASLEAALEDADCVILAGDAEMYDVSALRTKEDIVFVDAREHQFEVDLDGHVTKKTAAQRNDMIQVIYTGVVPVVYKAQRTLLVSLMDSIGWAFVLIAIVMCTLLWSPSAGLVSMLPNVFPVILIFGAMGFIGLKVDIGTMMTASVAMGVAVDDTIHYLMWFRKGIKRGLGRLDSIELAYNHVATAMTQTTLIGGLGLSVFWFSTFTPTQRFGVMMLTLLSAALVGDLVFLPAILASPVGKLFCPKGTPLRRSGGETAAVDGDADESDDEQASARSNESVSAPVSADSQLSKSEDGSQTTPHSSLAAGNRLIRRDRPHS